MENTSVKTTVNGIEMVTTINIPFCNKKPAGSDFDLDKARQKGIGYVMDVIGSFSDVLKASLERRMSACRRNLLNHLDDIEYADECGHIVYRRKDGSCGNFNARSFEEMNECVAALNRSEYKKVISKSFWIDQLLKALLNDTEMHHEDKGSFKYSELVSILMELHLQPIK